MSCPFYWWDHNYACRKSGKDVNEDIYYKYCRNYDYSDCPIYKQQPPSDSCYLTTACIKAKNLPDNCAELTTLRSFRDTYLQSFEEGRNDIRQYYHIAPAIVLAIDACANAEKIYSDIYDNLVEPCVKLISEHKFGDAHQLYKKTAFILKETFAPDLLMQ